MEDKTQTREQLITELTVLRQRLVQSEALETERKRAEQQTELSLRVMELLGDPGDPTEIKRQILLLIKDFSGCEAIGIRLKVGEDFPYYDTDGFVEGHVATESYLCALDEKGEIVRDSQGKALLECLCGNIIRGWFDSGKPFFTEGGSFWTNSTTDLLASTTEEDLLTRTRNRCHAEGYESVTLIPLKSDSEIIGLLQLNDRRRGRFTAELIRFYEGIAQSIGVVVARKRAEEALKNSEEQFRTSIENMLDCFGVYSAVRDESGRILDFRVEYVNEAACASNLMTKEEQIGKGLLELLPAHRETSLFDEYCQVVETGKPLIKESLVYEDVYKEQRLARAFDIRATKLGDGFVAAWRDISERKRAEEALQESETELSAIYNNAPIVMILVDAERRVRKVNRTAVEFTRRPEEEMIGLRAGEALRCLHSLDDPKGCGFGPSCEKCPVRNGVLDTFDTGESHHQVEAKLPFARGEKQEERDFLVSTAPLTLSMGQMVLVCIQDITERKQAEEELERSREQLRNLAAHLQSVREQEATQIGREIHDELGQVLTALKLDLSWLRSQLTEEQRPLHRRIRSMLGLIDSTVEAVRRISTALRPRMLDDLGLTAAIQWLTSEFQERTGITCHVVLRPKEIVLDKERSTTIFRIIQEALVNVTRHAGATNVRVSLTKRGGYLTLKVLDNGKGITKEQISDPKSFGIIGMQERVNFCGGKFQISGIRGKGTTIAVRIPTGLITTANELT